MADLKRLGIFKELSYNTIGDPYVPLVKNFLQRDPKLAGLRPLYLAGGYSKTKAANSDGYFAPFYQAFTGDPVLNINDLRRLWRREGRSKWLTEKDWVPSAGSKLRCGLGSPYGNFQEMYPAVDPTRRNFPYVPEKKNFYTNPGKKGTGYGYPDVCLSRFPEWKQGDTTGDAAHRMFVSQVEYHKNKVGNRPVFVSMCRSLDAFDGNPWQKGDPLAPGGPHNLKFGVAGFPRSMQIGPSFVPSSPAKLDGGMKAGTINKFPEYTSEPYTHITDLRSLDKSPLLAGPWVPQPPTAVNTPQPSIVNKNVQKSINTKNRKQKHAVWDFCPR